MKIKVYTIIRQRLGSELVAVKTGLQASINFAKETAATPENGVYFAVDVFETDLNGAPDMAKHIGRFQCVQMSKARETTILKRAFKA
jgi:hypothetical protein